MGNVAVAPGCWATVQSAGLPTSAPAPLPRILQADTTITLAPAIGQARLLIGDPDGAWAAALRPNDALAVTFSSRARQTQAGQAAPPPPPAGAPTPGTAAPAGASWTGLIDEAFEVKDPTAPGGRACLINASTPWKLLATTAVPLFRFASGQYPGPGITPQALFETALGDVLTNTGIAVPRVYEPTAVNQMTPPNSVPNNFLDPSAQSWASFVLGLGVIAGLEVFFDEAGTLQVRSPKFMRNVAAFRIPDEETFSRQAGASDRGLVTNVLVAYGAVPLSTAGVQAPAGGIGAGGAKGNSGPLPDTLAAPDGTPLPRLGQRFLSLQVPQFQTAADAGYFAATVRMLGLAAADQAEVACCLNGDLRVGQIVATPGNGKRYYLTTVQHSYAFGQQAVTRLSGRFGIGLDKVWDRSGLDGPLAYGQVALPGYPQDPAGGSPANLPPLSADPDVRITTPTLTPYDIAAELAGHTPPSPFSDQAGYISTEAVAYGIDPSFALAVWLVETQLGTDNSAGSQGHNPGNLGPGRVYPTWAAGIDAWFALLAGPAYLGAGLTTVGAIGPVYAPPADGNADWTTNVGAIMASIRQAATLPGVPQPPAPPQPPAGSVRDRIIQAARSQLGLPYLWAGYAPGVAWDCSALVQWSYAQAGLSIPRTAQTQYDASGPVAEDQIIPGDLVFFQHTYETSDRITHVGIALGGGQMLDAQNAGVEIESYQTAYWSPSYVGARRPAALGSS